MSSVQIIWLVSVVYLSIVSTLSIYGVLSIIVKLRPNDLFLRNVWLAVMIDILLTALYNSVTNRSPEQLNYVSIIFGVVALSEITCKIQNRLKENENGNNEKN